MNYLCTFSICKSPQKIRTVSCSSTDYIELQQEKRRTLEFSCFTVFITLILSQTLFRSVSRLHPYCQTGRTILQESHTKRRTKIRKRKKEKTINISTQSYISPIYFIISIIRILGSVMTHSKGVSPKRICTGPKITHLLRYFC